MEARRSARIVNPTGLHARPCGALVAVALEFESQLWIRHGDLEVNGKSILQVMTLGAGKGAELHLRAEGADAAPMLDRLVELIDGGFGE